MATSKKSKPRRRLRERKENEGIDPDEAAAAIEEEGIFAPGTTGRYLVLMREDAVKTGVKALSKPWGSVSPALAGCQS